MQLQKSKILQFFFIFCVAISCCILTVSAQTKNDIISGPWAGNVELRNATIWVEVSPKVKSVAVKYYPAGAIGASKTISYHGELGKEFNPVKIDLNGLQVNTTYNYLVIADGKANASSPVLKFTTKELWQWRKPAPDFSFLAGSCSYFNDPEYDRPGKPYGGDSSIFETMASNSAAFHLWLGDNWYTREVDYLSPWGLAYRASRDRSKPVLQKLLNSMPQYAIWDDHDYGPNDAGSSFILKEESRKVFMNYWCNPSYGEDGKGIYTKISYSDVDLFLTDDRYFRSEDKVPDSIDGAPNKSKHFFGATQLQWLENSLLYSTATFKIIATGSQVLNPLNDYECMKYYSAEYFELMNFLASQKVRGVIFLTGDRHHSEIIKMSRKGLFPLYDVTVSPYTSGIGKVRGAELNNPARVPGTLVEEENFARITVTGKRNERNLQVEFIGLKGSVLSKWSVGEKELRAEDGNKESN